MMHWRLTSFTFESKDVFLCLAFIGNLKSNLEIDLIKVLKAVDYGLTGCGGTEKRHVGTNYKVSQPKQNLLRVYDLAPSD